MATGSGTVNKVILVGRLGQDPELKYTPSGAAVTNLSVATNRVWKDQDGNLQKKTDWHRVTAWRYMAEFAGNYLKKGTLVYIEGRLETRSWTDQNDVTKYITEVITEVIQMVGSKPDRAEPSAEAPPPPPAAEPQPPAEPEMPPASAEDDLPF
ncbi:single-stranded DNA-binding protein [candidate division KSB1 bacterium]|nr:single-stranded DNA-binding protein [candidate division KSB1 bacterium]